MFDTIAELLTKMSCPRSVSPLLSSTGGTAAGRSIHGRVGWIWREGWRVDCV